MSGWLELAFRYVAYHRWKTAIMAVAIFLTALLPLSIRLLLDQFQQQLLSRAVATPFVVGSKGSPLDLTLHALHFRGPPSAAIKYREFQSLLAEGRCLPIPIYQRHTASGFPIVGTSLEYFDFRHLRRVAGRNLALLGDCVLGSEVARQLKLEPGQQLLSDRENVLDIAGLYPLKMNVVGVLAANQTADDRALFVDLQTAWVIAGLGHGHQNLATETDEGKILQRSDSQIVASAAVLPYTEITAANRDSFHFHGDEGEFPLTAILVVPQDQRAADLLQADFEVSSQTAQMVQPQAVIEDLLGIVFRVKQFFDANALLVACATALLLVLVILLSLKLRADEMHTMFKLGCSRSTMALMQIGELGIVLALSATLLLIALSMIGRLTPWILERMLG